MTEGNGAPTQGGDLEAGNNVLARGSSGDDVKRLQQALNERHPKRNQLEIDGEFGDKTYAAVRYHQQVTKVKVDGSVGPETWETLGVTSSPSAEPTAEPATAEPATVEPTSTSALEPTPPAPATPVAAPETKPEATPKTAETQAYEPPEFPEGLSPNRRNPSTVDLQRALKDTGFLSPEMRESDNYGPRTQAAVAKFNNANPQFKTSGVSREVRISPEGWSHLFRLAYGSQ